MDAYTLHLLGLAVEKIGGDDCYLSVETTRDGWLVFISPRIGWARPTLADALAALLNHLGVTVPERPKTAAFFAGLPRDEVRAATKLRDLYAREPLTVLALLEGGAS